MGNDGGSIPTRKEMVQLRKKVLFADPSEQARIKWSVCALKKDKLGSMVATDLLGNLFDKGNIIKALVDRSIPPQFSHIESIKDIIDLKFTANSKGSKGHQMGEAQSNDVSLFMCPISQRPANGIYGFSALTTCGHVFSDKGLLQSKLQPDQNSCYVCGTSFSRNQVLPLNPDDEQSRVLRFHLDEVKKAQHEEKLKKKEEKKKKREAAVVAGEGPIDKKRKLESKRTTSAKKTATVGLATAKKTTQDAVQTHDKRKKASESYTSIFAPAPEVGKSVTNVTGVYRR